MQPLRVIVRLLSLAIVLGAITCSAVAEVVVIAHRGASENSAQPNRILDFYTGDIRQWEDGTRVIVFDLKEKGETRERFFEFIGKSSSRMRTIWLKRMLSGEGDPPEALKTEKEMVAKVASTPGAIGFVQRKFITDSVKVIAAADNSTDK